MFQVVQIDEFTITKKPAIKSGSQITWNVDLNGKPFGQIWTFRPMAGYKFTYVSKCLNGESKICKTYEQAESFMRSQA